MKTIHKLRLFVLATIAMVAASAYGQYEEENEFRVTGQEFFDEKSGYSFSAEGDSKTFNITCSSYTWTVKAEESVDDSFVEAQWVSFSKDNGDSDAEVTITVKTNPYSTPRTATITVAGTPKMPETPETEETEETKVAEKNITFTITQSGNEAIEVKDPTLIVQPTSILVDANGGDKELKIFSDAEWWTITTIDSAGNVPTWIHLRNGEDNPSNEGKGNTTLTINIDSFDRRGETREADIIVKDSKNVKIVHVIQVGPEKIDLRVSPQNIVFDSGEGTQDVDIYFNNYWSFSKTGDEDAKWLHIYDYNDENNEYFDDSKKIIANKIIIKADSNPGDTRSATIIITDSIEGDSKSINIKQFGSGQAKLMVSPKSHTFDSSGGSFDVDIARNGVKWKFEKIEENEGVEWFDVYNPEKEGEALNNEGLYDLDIIRIAVKANPNAGTRSATVNIFEDKNKEENFAYIKITQFGNGTFELKVSPRSQTFESEGGSFDVDIASNGKNWIFKNEASSWLTIFNKANEPEQLNEGNPYAYDKINIRVGRNTEGVARSGKIIIHEEGNDGNKDTIIVTQFAAGDILLIVSPKSHTFDRTGGSYAFDIATNAEYWKFQRSGGADTWLHIEDESGTEYQEDNKLTLSRIVIKADQNTGDTRTATLAITDASGNNDSIKITQFGGKIELKVSPKSHTFDRTGGTYAFDIATNAEYWKFQRSGGADTWLHIEDESGTEYQEDNQLTLSRIVIKADQNTGETRTATVTINDASGNNESIELTQFGGRTELKVSPKILTYESAGGTFDVDIASYDEYWTVSKNGNENSDSDASWLTITMNGTPVSAYSKYSGKKISISAESNTGDKRTATVTVSDKSGNSESIEITQFGIELKISPKSYTFYKDGGSFDVDIATNAANWTFQKSEGASWLHVEDADGTERNEGEQLTLNKIVIKADQNMGDPRTATVTITDASYSITESIDITQFGGKIELMVSPKSHTFKKDGGTFDVDISSNDEYWTITKMGNENSDSDASWLTITMNGTPISEFNQYTGKKISISAESHTGDTRTATVTVTDKTGNSESIEITQFGENVDFEVTGYENWGNFLDRGEERYFYITTNLKWTVYCEENLVHWVHIEPQSGSGSKRVTITVDPNMDSSERKTVIVVEDESKERTVSFDIIQEGRQFDINFDPNKDIILSKEANNSTPLGITTLKADDKWEIDIKYNDMNSGSGWLKVSNSNGSGSEEINVTTTKKNESLTSRSATISVKLTDHPDTKASITAFQRGQAYLNVTDTLHFTVRGGDGNDRTFDIKSNTDWGVSASDWLTVVSDSRGKGNATVKLKAEQNRTLIKRPGEVKITYTNDLGKTDNKSVVIIQDAYPDTVNVIKGMTFSVSTENETIARINESDSTIIESETGEVLELSKALKMSIQPEELNEQWDFKWTGDGIIDSKITPQGKNTYPISVRVTYKNDSTIELHKFLYTLYPAPQSPTSLVKKGGDNNKSGIMIAITPLSESELASNGVLFGFQYGDSELGTTPNRYWQYLASQTNDAEKWVYTQWQVGSRTVQSIKKVNAAGGTRAVTTRSEATQGICVAIGTGFASLTGGRLIAHAESASKAVVTVVSTNGTVVKRMEYPARRDFDEEIDLGGLPRGLYIVRCNIGTMRAEEKVVIK